MRDSTFESCADRTEGVPVLYPFRGNPSSLLLLFGRGRVRIGGKTLNFGQLFFGLFNVGRLFGAAHELLKLLGSLLVFVLLDKENAQQVLQLGHVVGLIDSNSLTNNLLGVIKVSEVVVGNAVIVIGAREIYRVECQ